MTDAEIVREALVFMRDCGSRAGESTIADAALEAFARLVALAERAERLAEELDRVNTLGHEYRNGYLRMQKALKRIADDGDPLLGIGSECEFARAALDGEGDG